ncbi:hypothetical protein BFL40_14640 [Pseudomonas costantinii]|uniref:Uncharacterized protein n=1 Tax=Pseudomonas costantinii TaxID=168469 RepID=A0A1S2V0E3_9PSED|nr:hypothetical protein BFL40_14640 [Pseudomonas costantinii]
MTVGVFEDAVAGYTGLITSAAGKALVANFDITRWVPFSTDADFPDFLTIQLAPYTDLSKFPTEADEDKYFSDNSRGFTVQISNPGPIIPVPIPKSLRSAGVYVVRYSVDNPDLGNTSFSEPQLFIYDDKTPYTNETPPAPQPPSPLPVPFDRAFFASQPNETVFFTIPYDALKGRSEDDYAETRLGFLDWPTPIDPPDPETKFKLSNDPAIPATIPLSLKTIEAESDGNYRFAYRVCDVAGNCSDWSNAYRLTQVGVAPVPIDLLAPTVELAADAITTDGLINRADIAQVGGMNVGILAYTNIQRSSPSDIVRIRLTTANGVVDLTPITVGASTFPLRASATVAQLTTLYGNARGNLPLTVSWSVDRGGVIYPSALSTTINLDKSVVGPPPVDDTDVNPSLIPLVVNAIRANGLFGPDNHLERVDANLPARARVQLWTVATTPENSVPFTLTLVYGSKTYAQLVTAIPVSRAIDFTIPAADIISEGGPTVSAYYAITTAGSTNPQRPTLTNVIVDSVFKRMDAPVIRNTSGTRKTINCPCFVPVNSGALKVFLPPSVYLQGGSILTLTFEGFSNNTNTAPIVVTHTQTYSVPGTAAASGFEVDFGSFATLLKPIQPSQAFVNMGSANIRSSVQLPGETVSSDDAIHRVLGVRVGTTSPVYCDGLPVPA